MSASASVRRVTCAPLPPGRRVLRTALGLACLVAAGWTASVAVAVLRGLRPATAVLLAVVTLLGLGLLVSGLRGLPDARAGRRGSGRRVLAGVGRALLAVLFLALAGATAWLRPAAATSERIADGVTVAESSTEIVLRPATGTATTGLVLQPGALVAPQAYVPLASDVAAGGYEVVIVKQRLQVAFLATGAAEAVIAHHPEVTTWAVGGHSLGGVVAAREVDAPAVRGLLLRAAYPASRVADEEGLDITSVTASANGLTTPAKVAGTRNLLPAGTRFVEVDGAVHADFGDYGPQDGDGEPTTSCTSAQEQIVAASQALLSGLAR